MPLLSTRVLLLPLLFAPLLLPGQLEWNIVGRRPIPIADDAFTVARNMANGDVLLFSSRSAKVQRISPLLGGVHTFAATNISELEGMKVNWLDDIASTPDGSTLLPVIWRAAPRNTSFGLAVFDRNGAHRRMIRLQPPAEIRHFTTTPSGGFVVLGLDPAFFRRQTSQCLLLHEYAVDGSRIRSFSPCPEGLELLRPGQPQPGPGYQWLKDEVDRGKVWVESDRLYHLLPRSRSIRVFDLTGKMTRQIAMETPAFPATLRDTPSDARSDVADAFMAGPGQIVALWSRIAEGGGRAARSRYLAIHNLAGKAITPAALPSREQMPIGSAASGSLLIIERLNGTYQLLTANPRIQ